MRSMAIGILLVILVSIVIEPLVEISNLMREKITLGAALTNACRAAEDRSLQYEQHRDRNAVLDEGRFRDYFAEAFEDALDVTMTSSSGNKMQFASKDGTYNDFEVTLAFDTRLEANGLYETEVRVEAETDYKFKTKYLRMANRLSSEEYRMASERMLLVQIRN